MLLSNLLAFSNSSPTSNSKESLKGVGGRATETMTFLIKSLSEVRSGQGQEIGMQSGHSVTLGQAKTYRHTN